jgi:hypothetical protein
MTKKEFAEELRKRGLEAVVDSDGCTKVILRGDDEMPLSAIGTIAKKVGFTGSYGWRREGNHVEAEHLQGSAG